MTTILTIAELSLAATTLARALTACHAEYAIIGGAGVALHAQRFNLTAHPTADIDAIIQPNPARGINADSISRTLRTEFPDQFTSVSQYGVSLPAILLQRGDQPLVVEIELFDVETWPGRPQYDLSRASNARRAVQVGGQTVHVMSVAWLLREKIVTQAQREGSKKEASDILDITCLATIASDRELDCETEEFVRALRRLLEKRPELEESLRRVVKYTNDFERVAECGFAKTKSFKTGQ
ncbi:hypothetical protein PRK78_006935 [Emydomyces testavorans]|uniref:Nucleotidyl transferase AbiEii toxin, Type IV TA system n=1 Tax=Emydomyces testavorans TaxID=2070801 RepID=A0AAF0DR46_9EURO|nr:hypothetical protein PRK78_006935 [Emydomyces testavorans]